MSVIRQMPRLRRAIEFKIVASHRVIGGFLPSRGAHGLAILKTGKAQVGETGCLSCGTARNRRE